MQFWIRKMIKDNNFIFEIMSKYANLDLLLIDDDPINNMVNEKLLLNFEEQLNISIIEEVPKALNYLKTTAVIPDLILLDINMPEADGWYFLDKYDKLSLSIPVVLLTSSIDKDDMLRAKSFDTIKEYLIKPLKDETIKKLFEKFF